MSLAVGPALLFALCWIGHHFVIVRSGLRTALFYVLTVFRDMRFRNGFRLPLAMLGNPACPFDLSFSGEPAPKIFAALRQLGPLRYSLRSELRSNRADCDPRPTLICHETKVI